MDNFSTHPFPSNSRIAAFDEFFAMVERERRFLKDPDEGRRRKVQARLREKAAHLGLWPVRPAMCREVIRSGGLEAWHRLGVCFSVGVFKQGQRRSLIWWERAARRGYLPSMLELARFHLIESLESASCRHRRLAFTWNARAALLGDAGAQSYVGRAYLQGRVASHESGKAIAWLKRAAVTAEAAGNHRIAVNAHRLVADICLAGPKARCDPMLAVRHLELAGEYLRLGEMYLDGVAMPRCVATAMRYLEKAASVPQDAFAHLLLARLHQAGEGVEADHGKAALHYLAFLATAHRADRLYKEGLLLDSERDALMAERAPVECLLGCLHLEGRGVLLDEEAAAIYFWLGAEDGSAEAQYRLGLCFAWGMGIGRDGREAERWMRIAASRGHAKAKRWLGRLSDREMCQIERRSRIGGAASE